MEAILSIFSLKTSKLTNENTDIDKLMSQTNPASPFVYLSQFEFHHTLASRRGISIVFFSKPGCGSCRKWEQILLAYQHVHPAVSLYHVDVEQEPALAHEFELFHLPAMMLYTNGQFHGELQSEARVSALEKAIQTNLQAPPKEQP